jgi:hypothetical protein
MRGLRSATPPVADGIRIPLEIAFYIGRYAVPSHTGVRNGQEKYALSDEGRPSATSSEDELNARI